MPTPLLVAAHRLLTVLDLENKALSLMDLPSAAALLSEKTAAIDDLTTCVAARRPATPPVPRSEFVAIAKTLDGLALENRCLLERAIAVQGRVISIVVRAAATAVPQPVYGAQRGWRGRSSRPMAFSTRA